MLVEETISADSFAFTTMFCNATSWLISVTSRSDLKRSALSRIVVFFEGERSRGKTDAREPDDLAMKIGCGRGLCGRGRLVDAILDSFGVVIALDP